VSSVSRIGAVGYLNAKPLVYDLERAVPRVDLRFDVPSVCAALLHAGQIDVGLIPSIEYLGGPDYTVVPGMAIASQGPVASVALFSKTNIDRVQRIALDTSSRTSAALLRILCAERFDIAPSWTPAAPDLETMLAGNDAALLIGDPALFTDADRAGVLKIDLGEAWTSHTGLPFVWAFWAGPHAAVDEALCRTLTAARDAGVQHVPEIAAAYAAGDATITAIARRYLQENIKFYLRDAHEAALERFYRSAASLGLVTQAREVRFAGRPRPSAASA
jgi:chorismate dehydratase